MPLLDREMIYIIKLVEIIEMTDWNLEARRILRGELARKDISYKKLALLLEGIGVTETQSSINNKMSRGTFSFAFFLQCMKAIGRPAIEIDLREISVTAPRTR